MKNEKISIIIPVYNTEKYVEKSINSILNQSYKNIELIIINDGSTDNSEKIIKRIIRDNKNIKYKKIKNSGVAHARNEGLRIATGRYVGFVDSDDFVSEKMYETLYKTAIKEKSDIVTCAYSKCYIDRTVSIYPKDKSVFGKSVIESKNIFLNSNPYITSKLFSMKLINKYSIEFEEDLRIFEDLLFCYKLYLRANKISYVDELFYNYNCSNTSSLTNSFSEKMFDVFKALDRLKEYADSIYEDKLDEQIEYVALKHISLRFTSKSKNRKLLNKYVDQSFDYMKCNYKHYKKSKFFVGFKGFVKKNKFLVKLLVLKNNIR